MLESEKYPRLRSDLYTRRRLFSGEVFYVIKDPIRLEYFTVDEIAYSILALCNGRNDLTAILEKFNRVHPHTALDLPTLVSFLDNYRKCHFFEDSYETNVLLLEKVRKSRAEVLKKARQNLLEMHFPAWNPDSFFDRVIGKIGFLFTRKALVVYGLVVLAALFLAVSNPQRLTFDEAIYDLGGHPLIGVGVLWFTLLFSVVLHEIGHGLTCKHFGGRVYRIGFLLLYFNPCLFCDVTESYFFEKKSHKHAVTLAGAVVDLMVASFAVFVWYLTPDDLFVHKLSHRIMLLCGVTGIIFNLNPLLKYDGYFLLSNQLEIPDLRGDSFRYLAGRVRRLLRLSHDEIPLPPRKKRIHLIYGTLSLSYSVFVLVFVGYFAGSWLVGKLGNAGYAVTGVLVFLLTWGPLKKLGGFARFAYLEKRISIRRRLPRVLLVVAVLIAFVLLVPFPRYVKGPARVRPVRTAVVRAQVSGALESFSAGENLPVEKGTVLGSLDSRPLRRAAERSKTDLEIARVRCMEAENREAAGEARKAAIAEERALGIWRRSRELLEKTNLRAPVSGILVTPRVEERLGTYFEEGDSVCAVADLSRIELVVRVEERELPRVEVGSPLQVRLRCRPGRVLSAYVEEVSPEALPGVSPRSYRVTAQAGNPGPWIRPGMTGQGRIRAGWATLGARAVEAVRRWIRIDFWL
jgi:putative peptide zinc metalloprotease protein